MIHDPMTTLKRYREFYELRMQKNGEFSETTMYMGLRLGEVLAHANHHIEAERLVSKLAATCIRIYGREHNMTKEAQEKLD